MRPVKTLVVGGARSGKSRFALGYANEHFANPLYVATAEASDDEMRERIRLHRAERGQHWRCAEEPLDLAGAISELPEGTDGIVVDCLTVWLSNILLKEGEASVGKRTDALCRSLRECNVECVLVANEVGMGIVPDNELGRKFRDMAGRLNQDMAASCERVIMVVAGIPTCLKGVL